MALNRRQWSGLSSPTTYHNKSGDFSAAGDSGSIIADAHGRIGGLLGHHICDALLATHQGQRLS
jgi:hypothetical protein